MPYLKLPGHNLMAVIPVFIAWLYQEEFDHNVFAVAPQAAVGSIRQLLNQPLTSLSPK